MQQFIGLNEPIYCQQIDISYLKEKYLIGLTHKELLESFKATFLGHFITFLG